MEQCNKTASNDNTQGVHEIKSYKGLNFKILFTREQIESTIDKIASKINQFYRQESAKRQEQTEIVVICLLKGGFMYFTDLCRRLHGKIVCEFVKVSSYEGEHSKGTLTIQGGFDCASYKDKHVLIVDDMTDSGLTISKFRQMIWDCQPKTVKVTVLVDRPEKKKDFEIEWVGLQCSDFIIGYGLDYDQFGRNFPSIYQKV